MNHSARRRLSQPTWSRWEQSGAVLLASLVGLGMLSNGYNHATEGRTIGWLLCSLLGGWAVLSWAHGRWQVRNGAGCWALFACFAFAAAWHGLYLIPLPTAFVVEWSPVWSETTALLAKTVGEASIPASLPLATSPEAAWEAFDQAVAMMLVLPAILLLASNPRGVWTIAAVVVGISVLEAGLGLLVSLLGDSPRSFGIHRNESHHAACILMGLPALLVWTFCRGKRADQNGVYGLAGDERRDQQILLYCLIGAAVTAWMLASSRGSLVAAILAFGCWGIAEWRAARTASPRGSMALRRGLPLAVVGLLAAAIALLSFPVFSARLSDTNEANSRIAFWKATIQGLKEEPVLGFGPGGANFSINRFLEGYTTDIPAGWTHNDYVQLLGEFGVLGFLLLGGLVALTLVLLARDAAAREGAGRRQMMLRRGLMAGLATVFIHSFTDFHLRSPLFMIQTICLMALIVTRSHTYLLEKSGSEISEKTDGTRSPADFARVAKSGAPAAVTPHE